MCTPSRTPSRGESPSPHRPPPPGSLVHLYPAGGLALLAPAGLAAAAAALWQLGRRIQDILRRPRAG